MGLPKTGVSSHCAFIVKNIGLSLLVAKILDMRGRQLKHSCVEIFTVVAYPAVVLFTKRISLKNLFGMEWESWVELEKLTVQTNMSRKGAPNFC